MSSSCFSNRRNERQPQIILQHDADHAQRRAPQLIRIAADPVGFSPIAQKPTSVSSLSASATAIATASPSAAFGTVSVGPFGL